MIPSFLLAGALLLAQPDSSTPAPASPQDLPATVQRLVRQLNDEQLARREAAEKELTALGPKVLELLPQITPRTPAEVKDRLGRVRKILETAAVELATRPAIVTLTGEMTLEEALAALEKQTGNRVIDFRDRFDQQATPIKVTMEASQVTFWQALDELLDRARLTTYNYGGEASALTIVARQESDADRRQKASYAGQFRIEPLQLDISRNLRNSSNDSMTLTLDVAWEPRLRPIVISMPFRDLRLTDESGAALETDESGGEPEIAAEGNVSAAEINLPLKIPPRSTKRIGSLKGRLNVLAQGRIETFEFTDLDKMRNVEQKRAGVTVIFEQVRRNQDVYELRVLVRYDEASNALESHRGWIYDNPAYLLDPSGAQVENAGLEPVSQKENEVGLSYKFVLDKRGFKGYKFVYKTAASLIELPVEFELKEIELP